MHVLNMAITQKGRTITFGKLLAFLGWSQILFLYAIILGENSALSRHSLHSHITTCIILVDPPNNRRNPEEG